MQNLTFQSVSLKHFSRNSNYKIVIFLTGDNVSFGYQRLNFGSYLGFLVAMAVCLLISKVIILLCKLLNLQESIPYFDVFVSEINFVIKYI